MVRPPQKTSASRLIVHKAKYHHGKIRRRSRHQAAARSLVPDRPATVGRWPLRSRCSSVRSRVARARIPLSSRAQRGICLARQRESKHEADPLLRSGWQRRTRSRTNPEPGSIIEKPRRSVERPRCDQRCSETDHASITSHSEKMKAALRASMRGALPRAMTPSKPNNGTRTPSSMSRFRQR